MTKNTTKVAIIIDDSPLNYLVWDLFDKSLKDKKYEITAFIIQKNTNSSRSIFSKVYSLILRKGFTSLFSAATFQLIKSVEIFFLKYFSKFGLIFKTKEIDTYECEKISVRPKVSKSGLIYKYSNEDLEKIKSLNVDVLIRAGNGILKGEILNICKYGVLSFHHADNDVNRGGPAGFWEVYHQSPSTGFIIQVLNEELDGGKVILKGSIKTTFFYSYNWARILIKSNSFLHDVLSDIENYTNNKTNISVKPYSYKLYVRPTIIEQLKYIYQTIRIIWKKIFKTLLKRKSKWHIAFQYVDDWRKVVLRKSIVITNPKNRFLADPFIYKHDNRTIIFAEDYDFKTKKAVISAIEIFPNKSYSLLGTVLDENFHLSYPFIFETDDNIYMIPESSASNDIRLYKCNNFPMDWQLNNILIKDISSADSNIFFHNGYWWLMTNKDSSDLSKKFDEKEHESELHIYFSKELESNNWTKHPLNPVIFNSKRSRNAGKIKSENNQLFRVFQIQGFNHYGEKFGVAKIIELTPNSYKEEILFKVSPSFYKKITGTHHFSYDSGVVAIDYYS